MRVVKCACERAHSVQAPATAANKAEAGQQRREHQRREPHVVKVATESSSSDAARGKSRLCSAATPSYTCGVHAGRTQACRHARWDSCSRQWLWRCVCGVRAAPTRARTHARCAERQHGKSSGRRCHRTRARAYVRSHAATCDAAGSQARAYIHNSHTMRSRAHLEPVLLLPVAARVADGLGTAQQLPDALPVVVQHREPAFRGLVKR